MATRRIDEQREAMLQIAEAIAPTWERRRADIEEVATPVREWMLRELRPHEGDTVLELAAGVGDTGFEAAAIVGESGRLITSDFSPAMLDAARRPRPASAVPEASHCRWLELRLEKPSARSPVAG